MTNTTNNPKGIDLDHLEALARAATPGPREFDSTHNEGMYGDGPDASSGFDSYEVYCGNGKKIFDTVNSDCAEVHYENSDIGADVWDEIGRRNVMFVTALDPDTVRALIDLARRATPAPEAVPERCKHGVWAADHCYQCEPAATPSPEQGLIEAVRRDIIGFLRASTDYDAANRVEGFMTAQQIAKNISQQAAPEAPLDLSGLTLHYKEGVENGGYYLATDVVRLNGAPPVVAPEAPKTGDKPTKLPWRITDAPRKIVGADGATVANLTALDLPNAELIVASVNRAAPEAPASEQCTYPNCSCIGGGVFKPCVKHGAPPAVTTASASREVSKAELWDVIHQYVSDYGDQFREPPTTGAGKRCDASRNELAETIDRLYRAAAPSREAAPLPIEEERKHAEHEYTVTAFDYQRNPVGSRDWVLYWAGWSAKSKAVSAALAQQGATQAPANKKGGGNG